MFSTGLRMLRYQMALALGRPLHPGNAQHLLWDATRTLQEMGSFGEGIEQLLIGPVMDADIQDMVLKRTLRYVARTSLYYQKLFAGLSWHPRQIQRVNLSALPLTSRATLIAPGDFLARGTRPLLALDISNEGNGSSHMWVSRDELDLWMALAGMQAYAYQLYPSQATYHIALSSQNTLEMQTLLGMANLLDSRIYLHRQPLPDLLLEHLFADKRQLPGVLIISPHYLACLVRVARQRGVRPGELNVHTIECRDGILSSSLAQAAAETFGAVVRERYRLNEIEPAGGILCQQGHLHLDTSRALYELLAPTIDQPAAVGELARLVVTPYYPYRLCMPLLRYDTGDLVRRLPQDTLTCELAHLLATSPILGKVEHLLHMGDELITTRQLIEACESLPSSPWPARFQAASTPAGLVLKLSEQAFTGLTVSEVLAHFQRLRLPVYRVEPVPVEQTCLPATS